MLDLEKFEIAVVDQIEATDNETILNYTTDDFASDMLNLLDVPIYDRQEFGEAARTELIYAKTKLTIELLPAPLVAGFIKFAKQLHPPLSGYPI